MTIVALLCLRPWPIHLSEALQQHSSRSRRDLWGLTEAAEVEEVQQHGASAGDLTVVAAGQSSLYFFRGPRNL